MLGLTISWFVNDISQTLTDEMDFIKLYKVIGIGLTVFWS